MRAAGVRHERRHTGVERFVGQLVVVIADEIDSYRTAHSLGYSRV